MALLTFGSNAVTTLSALKWNPQSSAADVALIAANVKDDINPTHPISPGAFARNGILFVPNRGFLILKPGDFVAYDSTGWPIVVSAASVAANYTHS